MTNKPKVTNGGYAVIEDGVIVIRLPINSIPAAVEGAWCLGTLQTRQKVTDPSAFADGVLRALNEEDEVGTTRLHRMWDGAILEALEQGADGIEDHPKQGA